MEIKESTPNPRKWGKRKVFLKRPTRRKKASKKRVTKKTLWASYGLQMPHYVRYTGLQGVLWWVLSRYVRQSEFKEFGGECVDGCGRKVLDWREADCGHFLSATKLATRFQRRNLGLQTKYCNSPFMGNDNTYGYGKTINKRYGDGTAEELILLSQKKDTKPMAKAQMHEEILRYIQLINTLENKP